MQRRTKSRQSKKNLRLNQSAGCRSDTQSPFEFCINNTMRMHTHSQRTLKVIFQFPHTSITVVTSKRAWNSWADKLMASAVFGIAQKPEPRQWRMLQGSLWCHCARLDVFGNSLRARSLRPAAPFTLFFCHKRPVTRRQKMANKKRDPSCTGKMKRHPSEHGCCCRVQSSRRVLLSVDAAKSGEHAKATSQAASTPANGTAP